MPTYYVANFLKRVCHVNPDLRPSMADVAAYWEANADRIVGDVRRGGGGSHELDDADADDSYSDSDED